MASEKNLVDLLNEKPKKFPLGCDANKEEIFNYPYLSDEDTISFIKEHGRIMFIIRGPNSTLKATLSEMITTTYQTAQHCCADHFFSKTFSPPARNKETLAEAHKYCEKKVKAACSKNESPIIVQNTHIRKRELQKYLDLASVYNYTVVMAVTLYKFDVTPEALERINPDGLKVKYFQIRLNQWEDISPLFTGWFFCPNSTAYVLNSFLAILETLLDDGKFCHAFDCYDKDDLLNSFVGRRNLYCTAGYSCNKNEMKKYYFSNMVQNCYGKSYFITIHGYLITQSEVIGIVYINEEMKHLLLESNDHGGRSISERFSSLGFNDNINEYKATVSLLHERVISEENIILEDCPDDNFDFKNCKFIHVAQRRLEPFNIPLSNEKFLKKLDSVAEEMEFSLLGDVNVCRLPENEWLVKLPQKIKLKTLFTGLYI